MNNGQQEIMKMLQESPDRLGKRLTPNKASEFLGGSPSVSTLATMRCNEPDRIPFFRTGQKGGRVFYFEYHLKRFTAMGMQGV